MRIAVGVPPPSEPSPPSSARPDLFIVEAGEPRDRTCAECGKKTARWKPGRRRGAAVILCEDCTAKPPAVPAAWHRNPETVSAGNAVCGSSMRARLAEPRWSRRTFSARSVALESREVEWGFTAPAIEEWTEWDLNPRLPPCEGGDLPLIYRPSGATAHRGPANRFRRARKHGNGSANE